MTDTSLQVFNNEDFGEIRALAIDNEPWFVASDIAKALGYRMASDMTRRLDEDEKGTHSVRTPSGEQDMTIITEAGMYNAVLGSKIPEARRFKRWVTHDVLPAIRRHGIYATPDMAEAALADPDVLIAALTALKDERRRSTALMEDNARMLPKAVAYDAIIDTDGTMTVTEAARYLTQMGTKMSVRRLYDLLRADSLVCKRGNAPTKSAIQRGLAIQVMTTRPDGKANDPYARLTQKGLDWCVTHYLTMPSQMRA